VFTGKVPFTGESAIAVGFKHLKELTPTLNSVQRNLPQKLTAIVDRLLQKDPAHRYQSIRELRRDLDDLHEFRSRAISSAEAPLPAIVKQ